MSIYLNQNINRKCYTTKHLTKLVKIKINITSNKNQTYNHVLLWLIKKDISMAFTKTNKSNINSKIICVIMELAKRQKDRLQDQCSWILLECGTFDTTQGSLINVLIECVINRNVSNVSKCNIKKCIPPNEWCPLFPI